MTFSVFFLKYFSLRLGLSLLKNQTTYSGADVWFNGYTANIAPVTELNQIHMEKGILESEIWELFNKFFSCFRKCLGTSCNSKMIILHIFFFSFYCIAYHIVCELSLTASIFLECTDISLISP